MSHRVALVFGASGISGWAMARELLRYPTPTTFSRVIALSNRPLPCDVIILEDPRLTFVSGVNLVHSVEDVIKALREKVPSIDQITHVYWYAYAHAPTEGSQTEVNGQMLDTTLRALGETSPRLEYFLLQTGAKYYGMHLAGQITPPPIPFKEDAPRIPEPLASENIFYYRQLDIIAEHAKSATWKWNDIRPDVIVGYAPTNNPMNLALVLGVYLALYRAVHGRGAKVALPASIIGANALNSESPADYIARCAIWLSLHGDSTLNGRGFNVAVAPSRYAERWPALAGAWGLEGVSTQQDDPSPTRAFADVLNWVGEHTEEWGTLEREHGLRPGVLEATSFDFLFVMSIPLDRILDTSAIKEAGFTEEGEPMVTYCRKVWALFADAKVLPPL
ncbi:hypothetical protein K488DRAFT_73684 [Vararia minispora EC-137]|uniref:Uncharacterized protein n=1 Tax=Vararia minispora EC-137 TaxID=1314806 RepID=A0ACB8Q9S7_9AGAM|nr:hypothetical protein K488DRAFT_73684 [Vararia minispora EC-137]